MNKKEKLKHYMKKERINREQETILIKDNNNLFKNKKQEKETKNENIIEQDK